MHQIFEHWAAEGPARPCLIFDGQQLTYGEVDARANQLAHHLIALGVTPGSSVGVMMERSFGALLYFPRHYSESETHALNLESVHGIQTTMI